MLLTSGELGLQHRTKAAASPCLFPVGDADQGATCRVSPDHLFITANIVNWKCSQMTNWPSSVHLGFLQQENSFYLEIIANTSVTAPHRSTRWAKTPAVLEKSSVPLCTRPFLRLRWAMFKTPSIKAWLQCNFQVFSVALQYCNVKLTCYYRSLTDNMHVR